MPTDSATTAIQDPEVKTVTSLAKEEADKIIKRGAMLATGASMIPLPAIDIALVSAVQINMVKQLCEAYGVPYQEHRVRVAITSIIGATIARFVAYGAKETLDAFSQYEGMSDLLTSGAIGGFFTAATGEIYSMHFEGGGTLETLDISNFIDYVSEQIKNGELHPQQFTKLTSGFSYLY